jgi:hypothetical protein
MRYEISLREVSVACIPRHWAKILLKRRWFRAALQRGPPTLKECGEKRDFPSVVGRPPREAAYRAVAWCCTKLQQAHVSMWSGRKVTPYKARLVRTRSRAESPCEPTVFRYRIRVRWGFVWPEELYSLVCEFCPEILLPEESLTRLRSLPDSPFLTCLQFLEPGRVRRCWSHYNDVAPPYLPRPEPSSGVRLTRLWISRSSGGVCRVERGLC